MIVSAENQKDEAEDVTMLGHGPLLATSTVLLEVTQLTESPELIRVRDLCKIYKMGDIQVQALRGINLGIHRGEFVRLWGHQARENLPS